jgi:hypothetical protein
MLMGFEILRKLIQTVILTGRVKDHQPVSLLLIAPAERGKTSIALERPCKSTVALSDVTGGGLREMCKAHPEISHFVLTDFVAITSHKSFVAKGTISMLNAITEEGLQGTAYPGAVEFYQAGKRAIIGCLTTTLAADQRQWWTRTGFASRMLPFGYDHPDALQIKIHDAISEGRFEHTEVSVPLRIPDGCIAVRYSPMAIRVIRALAEHKGKELGEIGYRRHKQYRTLAAAHAIGRSWKKPLVGIEDIQFIKSIDPYVSYTETRLL